MRPSYRDVSGTGTIARPSKLSGEITPGGQGGLFLPALANFASTVISGYYKCAKKFSRRRLAAFHSLALQTRPLAYAACGNVQIRSETDAPAAVSLVRHVGRLDSDEVPPMWREYELLLRRS